MFGPAFRVGNLLQGLQEDEKLGVGSLMLAGGLAGMFFWAPVYPADVVKSKIQVDDFRNPAYKGTLDCAIKVTSPSFSTTGCVSMLRCREGRNESVLHDRHSALH